MILPFTNRESYLTWRAAWRANYAKLSATIRQCRLDGCRSQRDFYRVKAREQMEIRKQSKIQSQEQFLAARAAARAAVTVAASHDYYDPSFYKP